MADGNIDNLNFEVLLKDQAFKDKIEADLQLAKSFNTELSKILDFKTELGKGIKIVSSESKKDVKDVADGMGKVEKKTKDAKDAAKGLSSEYRTQSKLLRELGSIAGTYLSVRGAERFLSSLVRITGEFEVQKMALTSMLGSAATADSIFSQLRKNALESPYTFQDLTKFAKQLTAFNIAPDKLIETEKMLADVSAGLGVDMGRIILAYGQVKAAGALKGQELRQFTEAGVPLLQSLADQIAKVEGRTIALSEVFNRISKKEIPFEMVEQAFKDMTSEGGKFYNMQAVLVETLQGKIGKLRDVWQQTLYDIGTANDKTLKGAVDLVTKFVANLDKVIPILIALVKGVGAYAAVSAVAWSATKISAIGTFAKEIWGVVKALRAATAATTLFQALTGPIAKAVSLVAALGVGIYSIIKGYSKQNDTMRETNKLVSEYNAAVQTETLGAKNLFDKLDKLKKGTTEYKTVKDQILDKYGQYLSDVDKEKIAVGNLAGVYDNLKSSIAAAAKQRFVSQGMEGLEADFAETLKRIGKRLGRITKGDTELYGELMSYIMGDKNYFDLSGKAIATINPRVGEGMSWGIAIKSMKEQYAEAEKVLRDGEARLEKVLGDSPITSSIVAPGANAAPWSPKGWKDTKTIVRTPLEALQRIDPTGIMDIARVMGVSAEPLSDLDINKLAAQAFKNATAGRNLSKFKYKSIGGIIDILGFLDDITAEGSMDKETREKIGNNAEYLAKFNEIFNDLLNSAKGEAGNALAQKLKALASGILELGDALSGYGSSSGNDLASAIGSTINEIGALGKSVAQGFSTGGAWGAAVAAAVSFGKAILADAAYVAELEKNISKARLAKWAEDMNNSLSGDGFFGENALGKLTASADVARKALEKLQQVRSAVDVATTSAIKFKKSAYAGISADTKVKTIDRGWFGEGMFGDKVETLGSLVANLGYELYDAYGNINADALQAILDTYTKLGSADRAWMEEAITYAKEYKSAMESAEEVTKEIFGNIASSAADTIVDSWAQAGDAALDYADILDDVARAYAKMLVQSTLIDSVFTDDFKDQLNAFVANGDVAGAMALVSEGMEKVVGAAPMLEEILAPLRQYIVSGEDTDSVSSGIKGITEDTANLLAAYINAMRADVAAGNAQRGEILAILKDYVGMGTTPSYTEYLVQIEAHTANLAASTNSILSELRSIITPESGLPAVRVQTA